MSAAMETTGAFAANEQQSRVPYPDGRDYDTQADRDRCREEQYLLEKARGKGGACPTPEVAVLVRGDQRTFELRERLKAAGLHWLRDARAWSGSVPCEFVPQMQAEGLQVVPVVPDSPQAELGALSGHSTLDGHPLDRFAERASVAPAPSPKAPLHKPRSRTRREAPVKVTAEERAEAFLPEHGWTLQDITANLADDDRAEDERRVERHLRDLRSRVKAVRAKIAADPTIRQTLAINPEKARAFYAIHGVTAAQVRHGVPDVDVTGMEWESLAEQIGGHFPGVPVRDDWVAEEAERANAILPGSEVEV